MRKRAALGTRSCYTTGCDHPECRAANTAYFQARRAAEKAAKQEVAPAGVSGISAGERRGVQHPMPEVPAGVI